MLLFFRPNLQFQDGVAVIMENSKNIFLENFQAVKLYMFLAYHIIIQTLSRCLGCEMVDTQDSKIHSKYVLLVICIVLIKCTLRYYILVLITLRY